MSQINSIDALRSLIAPAHPLTRAKILDRLDDQAQAFIARSPFLLLATQNADGSLEVSPKGEAAGFVAIENNRTILIPDRTGNNLAFGLTNLLTNPNVGIIFLLPATGDTLRLSGRATLHDDADVCARLAARGKPAKLFLRVAVIRAYFHCARSILRAELWKPETWGAPFKISVGRIVREQTQGDGDLAKRIDEHTELSYRRENL